MAYLGVQFWVVVAMVGLGGCHRALAGEPRLDGLFDEWTPAHLIAADPAGDATGAFDVTTVYATNRGSRLFLRFDIGSIRNLQSGATADGTLRVHISMPNNRALTIDIRSRALWRDNNPNLTVSWLAVGYSTAPTYAASEFELSVDLAMFGVGVGSAIAINFSGSDALAAGADFVMSEPAVPPARRPASPAPGTAYRIASLNTEQTGLLNSTRRPMLLRLIDAVNADIYCFQEEYNSSSAQVRTHLLSVDPTEDGANWTVHKNNDCVIATRWSLTPLPSPNTATAGAVVDFGDGNAIVVFSIHPKCCGYIGSTEDTTRISQMNGLIGVLNNLRAGVLGAALLPYRQAPAIIIGDWNLVGSRTPLDMVLDPLGPNLTEALPANLIGEDVMTWRGSSTGSGSFSPGRLDLLAYDAARGLNMTGAFLLDSQLLNAAELAALGLQSADSTASDHLMMVGDFAFAAPPPACPGDADGDGLVSFADITSVLTHWGGSGVFGDANGDGMVNFADITEALTHWGSVCE